MLTAVNGFRKTEISPLNPEVFDDWMFEPSKTTNRSLPEMDSATPNLTTQSQTQTTSLPDVILTSCSEPETLSSTPMASYTIASPAEKVFRMRKLNNLENDVERAQQLDSPVHHINRNWKSRF